MRYFVVALVLIAAVLLSGCGKPKYWVKGLTLPPGSTVTQESETKEMAGMSMPLQGQVERSLMVTFDNPGGWAAVAAHFDKILTSQGYSESMGDLASMMPPGTGSSEAMGALNTMRMYSKGGSVYSIMVQDVAGMMGAVGQGQSVQGMPGMSGYALVVMESK